MLGGTTPRNAQSGRQPGSMGLRATRNRLHMKISLETRNETCYMRPHEYTRSTSPPRPLAAAATSPVLGCGQGVSPYQGREAGRHEDAVGQGTGGKS